MDDYSEEIFSLLKKSKLAKSITKEDLAKLLERPPNPTLGDFALPCFALAKLHKTSPVEIATQLRQDMGNLPKNSSFSSVDTKGPYLNFFLDKTALTAKTLAEITKRKDFYGGLKVKNPPTFIVEYSSPNIAKPFGIGHLRSTIIGNALANIASELGHNVVRINYLGDWGTPFGKIIAGYLDFGNEKKLKKEPIKHLYEIYVKTSKQKKYEDLGREWFTKLEKGDAQAKKLWQVFKNESLNEFQTLYEKLNVKFDVFSGESNYNDKMEDVVKLLQKKKLLKEDDGAQIVDLNEYNLGVVLIKKSDGATLYATRDLAAAIERAEKYQFATMYYEVGQEQTLHFRQIFKVLELMGYKWAKDCFHIAHGLYMDKDGKKFATRKGKTIMMDDIIESTKELVKKELKKRKISAGLKGSALEERALAITRAAIIYGDLKNYRANNMVFDLKRFVDFEGDTGPYLLYSYARATSILEKAEKPHKEKHHDVSMEEQEKQDYLVTLLSDYPQVLLKAHTDANPAHVANYAFQLAKTFNEFYHLAPVLGSEHESLRLNIVRSFRITLKNALRVLGIDVIEKM